MYDRVYIGASKKMQTPLSQEAVAALLPGGRVMKYGALARKRRLPKRPFVVLYETEPNWGHWVAVVDTPEGIEHFDSYGIVPDRELTWVPPGFARESGQNVKHLLQMLYDEHARTGVNINYNAHKFQGPDSSTCGRWCVLRNMFARLGNDAFHDAVMGAASGLGLTPDELVVRAIPE
jgi:hypothetical protein